MKLFIDTAEIQEIEAAAKTGLIDGVTTNPSLVAKAGVHFETLLRRICEAIDGPVSAEVTELNAEGMLEQAFGPGKAIVRVTADLDTKMVKKHEELINAAHELGRPEIARILESNLVDNHNV